MNEFTAWIQNNWYEMGNLLAEFVFLGVGIWFARKILRTLRASQEQFGALLRMSVTGAAPEPERQAPTTAAESSAAERSFATGSPYWLTPSEAPAAGQPTPILSDGGRGIVAWLNEPMKTGNAAPWRRVVRWLQSPTGS
jgi:hypothetical protein